MALSRQVVNFIRLNLLDDADQVVRIGQIAVMKGKASIFFVGIMMEKILIYNNQCPSTNLYYMFISGLFLRLRLKFSVLKR